MISRVSQFFSPKKNNANADMFIDESNMYKKEMKQLLRVLDLVANEEMSMQTDDIVKTIVRFGQVAHLGGPSLGYSLILTLKIF